MTGQYGLRDFGDHLKARHALGPDQRLEPSRVQCLNLDLL
jgi:hypothetical protein